MPPHQPRTLEPGEIGTIAAAAGMLRGLAMRYERAAAELDAAAAPGEMTEDGVLAVEFDKLARKARRISDELAAIAGVQLLEGGEPPR